MKRNPVLTALIALTLVLSAALGLVFLRAYRSGITIRLGDSAPPLSPPPAVPAAAPAPGYTNERLHSMLQEETAHLGIRGFLSPAEHEPQPAAEGGFLGPRLGEPGTRAQAENAIRDLAHMRRAVDAGKKQPVPLAGRTAPILAEPEAGGAIEPQPPAPAAPQESPARAPAADAWSGLYGGTPAGTFTVSDVRAWAALWRGLSRQPTPPVDFSRQEVVGVFLGPRPSGGWRVEIASSVTELPAAVVVRYQEFAPAPGRTPPEGATAPYALRVITRTSLPVRFEKIP